MEEIKTPVNWEKTQNAQFPYQAVVNHQRWVLRINDFPDEPLYTLFIDDQEILDLDDWPAAWQR